MNNFLLSLTMIAVVLTACSRQPNPFFTEWKTPFSTPPFGKIKTEYYMPAFEKGIDEQKKEIEKIISNPDVPTFQNTIEALEYSGALLNKVSGVF